MSIQSEMGAAWGELQNLFSKTATIAGVSVPVTSGAIVRLGEDYGAGGINETQAVQIYSRITGGPVPVVGEHLEFKSRTYRIEVVRQLTVTWEIDAVQVVA